MEATYGRSPGGYLWAVAEPVAAIAVMSVIFALVLRAPGLGTNFPYFYATGFLPFAMYLHVSQHVATSIRFSRQLLEYPAVSFLDALLARFALNALTHLLVMALTLSGIIWAYELRPILNWPAILLALAMALALSFAVGVVNCLLFSLFQVWERIWAVLNRPMFVLACILFLPETVPQPYRAWLMFNPLAHITTQMRSGFYATYDATLVSPVYVFGLCLVLTVPGLFLLQRHHKFILSN
jgi:capsular polysaccharide transport system permease protein